MFVQLFAERGTGITFLRGSQVVSQDKVILEERDPKGKPAHVHSTTETERKVGNIYYHDIKNSVPWELRARVLGLEFYGGRALAVSTSADWVILPRAASLYLTGIERHYDEIGLRHGVGYVFGDQLDLKRCPAHFTPSVYRFDRQIHSLFPDPLWLPTVELLGSKNYFMDHCDNLAVERPETTVVRYRSDRPVPSRYPVEVKLDQAALGYGHWRCEHAAAYEAVVEHLQVPYQVQAVLPPGTDFFIVEYERTAEGQLLAGVVVKREGQSKAESWCSAVFTSTASALTRITDVLAQWAFEQGMRGVWSYEVAVTPGGAVLPLECRPGWSDVSYPVRLAKRLGMEEWETQRFTGLTLTPDYAFSLGELTYRSRIKEGAVIYNWATLANGYIDVLIAGNGSARAYYQRELSLRYQSVQALALA